MTPVAFSEIVAALQARALQVAQVYAPGGHVDGGRYWALNPGRGDRRIGSFHVGLQGSFSGRWRDEATGEQGDMLDLIQMALRLDRKGALEEARRFLGLAEETPAQRDLRRRQDARAAEQRAKDAARAEGDAKRKRAQAHSLWLRCHDRLEATPVADYLHRRGVGLERLGRSPGAIRYHPDLRYHHVDPGTGEVFEGSYPAMVTAIYGPHVDGVEAAFWGVHRTWLARGPDGRWGKAPVPRSKKVFGSLLRGYIRLWSGQGPRGGHGPALSKVGPGAEVYVTEGIEDGLSVVVLKPEAHVVVAVSLGNLREIVLPPNVAKVTLVRDNDPGRLAREQADRAIERWLGEGRSVAQWLNHHGGKDLNDALLAALEAEGAM